MAAGERFTGRDRQLIDATIRSAEQLSRFEFSVYVGAAHHDPRSFATQLHNSLVAPARSVLIMVDPDARALEIVTGGTVRAVVDDTAVLDVVSEMQEHFTRRDVVAGINRGITRLAEIAHAARAARA